MAKNAERIKKVRQARKATKEGQVAGGPKHAGGVAVRIAMAQLPVKVGDYAGNAARILEALRQAENEDASVLLTPEMGLSGYPVEDLLGEDAFIQASEQHTLDLAGQTKDVPVIIGAPVRATTWPKQVRLLTSIDAKNRTLINAAITLQSGTVQNVTAKTLLPTYSVFDDARWFAAGGKRKNITIKDTNGNFVTAGVLVCEDIWAEGPADEAVAKGAQILLVINASPYTVGKPAIRESLLTAAAKRLGVPVAYLNAVGGQDELVFDGGSLIATPDGVTLRMKQFEEDYTSVEVELNPKGGWKTLPALESSPHEEAYRALVRGMKDYSAAINNPRILIGLSGGIDSALAATIAVDAVGAENVWGIGLPGPYSSQGSVDDARALAENLGIRFQVISIADAYQEREKTLAPVAEEVADAAGKNTQPVAWENLQARLRGVTLMTLANANDYLVCSTGNRSESAVGYFTLYGDSCGTAPNPLGDLLKTDTTSEDGEVLPGVYGLAAWRNQQEGGIVIPENTITKPPSAELAEGQQDTDSLPPYEVLDPILRALLENRENREQLTTRLTKNGTAPAEAAKIIDRVLTLVDRSEFKRRQVPFRIKISSLSFGRDRRMPLANAWRH